ncbi:MAG: ABC transporter substrate-binding protein [Pontiellaceae bacterium]
MRRSYNISYRRAVQVLYVIGCTLIWGCSPSVDDISEENISYSQTSRIRGLDPAVSGEVSASLAISKIYEGLLQYDYLARPYRVIPLLAESMPTISSNGLTYTFSIRKDIYFQDDVCFEEVKGRELTAHDFVYSIKRVADVKNSSSGFWAFNNRILGLNDFHDHSKEAEETDYDFEVEGLTALDRYTLQIKLTKPYPQLLYILTMHYSYVVPREAVEYYGKDFVNHPVGTGPYRLVEWRRNSRIEFERNPTWASTGRKEFYPHEGTDEQRAQGLLVDAGKPIPFIDRIIQYVIDDSTTSWMMFLSGELGSSAISRDNWDAVITPDKSLSDQLQTQGIDLTSSPTLDIGYIGFNWDDPILGQGETPEEVVQNRKLRQALSCAFDFDQLNRFMNHRLYRINGPIPSPLKGSISGTSPYDFDLDKARRLLNEAGYPDGIDPSTGRRLEITIELGSASGNIRQMMELMADMFRKMGVVLKPSFNTWPAFIEKMNRRQAQMFQLGWVADYPDAENFMQLFYSKNESPGPNHANYRNDRFDELYEKIRTMHDSDQRTRYVEEMVKIVIEDAPWIFLYQPMQFGLVHNWVQNYVPHAFPYGMGKYRRINAGNRSDWLNLHESTTLDFGGN